MIKKKFLNFRIRSFSSHLKKSIDPIRFNHINNYNQSFLNTSKSILLPPNDLPSYLNRYFSRNIIGFYSGLSSYENDPDFYDEDGNFLKGKAIKDMKRKEALEKKQSDQEQEKEIPFDGIIPKEKLDMKYVRAGGPGGQNVNKLNTKVDLRFNVDKADWIPESVKKRFKEQQKNRINLDNEYVIQASVQRTQEGNLKDAMNRLKQHLESAYKVPKRRVVRKEQRSAKGDAERLKEKKIRSEVKRGRQRNFFDD